MTGISQSTVVNFTSITFPNVPAGTSFLSNTSTSIVVKVPADVLRGKVILNVLNSTLSVLFSDI